MANNKNLFGAKPEGVGTVTKQHKPGNIKLNMSGQVNSPMPKASTLEEKTKGFKFGLPAKKQEAQIDVEQRQQTVEQQPTQEAQLETPTQETATNLSQYQHPDQPETAEPDATQNFKENLALLQAAFGQDKDAVAANVRNCMVYLQDHPELRDILQPEDVQIMVRGLRTSYSGISSAKRNKKTTKVATNKDVDEVVDLLSGFELKI